MHIIFYPEQLREGKRGVSEYIDSLKREQPEIYGKVQIVLAKVKDNGIKAIEDLKRQKICTSLGKGIYEFRIPPQAKGGVLRIYFVFHTSKKDTIVILDAEFKKHDKANLKRVQQRRKRYE